MTDERLGASMVEVDRCGFRVWAPKAQRVEVKLLGSPDRIVDLRPSTNGYHEAIVGQVRYGDRYRFRFNEIERPDPASRWQPEGVHGPSAVIDVDAFTWEDAGWRGRPLAEYILYELHVGTFSTEGTFDGIIPHLDELQSLGITAIELMPVAQCPGSRNWGYDGVLPFAAQHSYGGPDGLQRLVNACHQRGLTVVLDVVYNHLGPEGNYLGDFGWYFTDTYQTPWGAAINFDGPHSDEVRRYFLENARSWIEDFHIDGLRLDALHAIIDRSAKPFIEELVEEMHALGRRLGRAVVVIGESDANDSRMLAASHANGLGLDAQWNDDFHHALHALVTGERAGYYQSFGEFGQLVKTLQRGYVYDGQYNTFRKRRHGRPLRPLHPEQLVVYSQNHDQVGNRILGDRLSTLVSFEHLKVVAALTLLSPFVPLLFMGEEYAERAPFLYFVSHTDPALVDAVRRGRRDEFRAFGWQGDVPDPEDEQTFLRCKLRHDWRQPGPPRVMREFYQTLILLRTAQPALRGARTDCVEVIGHEASRVLSIRCWHDDQQLVLLAHLGDQPSAVPLALPLGTWQKQLDSAEARWQGPGSAVPAEMSVESTPTVRMAPWSCVLLSGTRHVHAEPESSVDGHEPSRDDRRGFRPTSIDARE